MLKFDLSTRKEYTGNRLLDDDFIVIINRKKEKIIPPHKWFINKNTPVGEDAELYEIKPHGGKKRVDFNDIVATMRPLK